MISLTAVSEHIDYVFLMFIRVSGILISSPIFGRKNVPSMSKIGFCVILTIVFVMSVPEPSVFPVYRNMLEYGLVCVKELLFGVAMGFVLTTMFNVVMTAGAIMDYQIGYSMASIYDPQNNTQTPVTGSFFNIMLIVSFFSLDGHLRLIEVLYKTVEAVPIGAAAAPPAIMWVAAEVMSSAFVLSVMVAMPVLAAGLVLEIALGAMIKTVPQMNMFVVGIPFKIILGLLMLTFSVTIFADFSKSIFNKAFDYIGIMFNILSGTA